jgi:hypothetical protein
MIWNNKICHHIVHFTAFFFKFHHEFDFQFRNFSTHLQDGVRRPLSNGFGIGFVSRADTKSRDVASPDDIFQTATLNFVA